MNKDHYQELDEFMEMVHLVTLTAHPWLGVGKHHPEDIAAQVSAVAESVGATLGIIISKGWGRRPHLPVVVPKPPPPQGGNAHSDTCPLSRCAVEDNEAHGGDGDVRCKGCEHGECRCTCDN